MVVPIDIGKLHFIWQVSVVKLKPKKIIQAIPFKELYTQQKINMQSLSLTIKQYELLTDWYLSALEGIYETDGSRTINELTNSLEWLAGHLIAGLYSNIIQLGVQIEPYKHLNKFVNQTLLPPRNSVAFDSKIKYRGLSECKGQWINYSKIFLSALKSANESILKNEVPFPVLTGGNTAEDALKFLVLHETYHIGQMGILRKSLGYSPMQLLPRK